MYRAMYVCTLVTLLVASIVQAESSSASPCPPWFIFNANISTNTPKYSHCFCSYLLPYRIMCDQMKYTSYLNLGNCAFLDNVTGDTIVGDCPYMFPGHLFVDHLLKLPQDVTELNSVMCDSLSREVGQSMCGRCANGTGPSVTSLGSQCVECKVMSVLYYILLRYLPATIIFLLILLFQINVASAPMAHYILYSNVLIICIQSNVGFFTTFSFADTYYNFIVRAFLALSAIWSFNPLFAISPPACFSTHIEDIDILYLEMLATLYPFFLLVLAYVVIELHARGFKPVVFLWRPLHQSFIRWRRSWNPRASLVQSFATIFFISYANLIFLVGVPLRHIDFTNQHGNIMYNFTTTYIDPTVHYGDHKHFYLMVFSAVIFIFIILPPILILMAYPTRLFRRLQNRLSSRVNLSIETFVSTFQGCYKDGLNGTRDYRSLSGGILAIFVIVMMVGYGVGMSVEAHDRQPIILQQVNILIMIVCALIMVVLRPYKSEIANFTGVCLPAVLAAGLTFYISLFTSIHHVNWIIFMGCVVLSLPHCCFYCYVLYIVWTKVKLKVIARVCCKSSGTGVLEQQALINKT